MVDALKLAGVAIAAIAVAGCASGPTAPTTAEKAARIKATGWQPGGAAFMPAEVLDMYPCHSAELPCQRAVARLKPNQEPKGRT